MKIIIILLALLPISSTHAKSFYDDVTLGMGMTDNANFESSDTDSDTYTYLENTATYITKKSDWSAWVSYKDYSEQTTNNSLSWRIGLFTPGKVINKSSSSWDLALGGLKYTESEPASSEDGFDYTNFEITYINQSYTESDNKLNIESRYIIQHYSSDRLDHSIDFHNIVGVKSGKFHLFSPYLDAGFTYSSDALNTKYFYELGLKWSWDITKSFSSKIFGLYSSTTYLNRTTSSVTLVSKNKKTASSTTEESETQTISEFGIGLSQKLKLLTLNLSSSYSNQSSNSGNETYSEVNSKVSISVFF